MPRKYTPVGRHYWEHGCDTPYAEAHMVESQYGEWVKLETFKDTTALLTKENQRQQKELDAVHAILAELIASILEKGKETNAY